MDDIEFKEIELLSQKFPQDQYLQLIYSYQAYLKNKDYVKSIFTIIKIQKEAKNLNFGVNLTLNNVISDMGNLLVDELKKNPGCNQYIKYIGLNACVLLWLHISNI